MKTYPSFPKRKLIYFIVLLLITGGFINYAVRGSSTFSLENGNPVVLGLSIVEQDPSAILDELRGGEDVKTNESNIITSFLLQSSNPSAQVFLDYIFILPDDQTPSSLICFQEIETKRSNIVPTQLFSESDALAGLKIENNSYIYEFKEDRCAQKGKKHIVPHILLGIVPVASHADLLFWPIEGFRASQFYPFDEQQIELKITVKSDEFEPFSPSLQVVVAQKGWNGVFINDGSGVSTLNLFRPEFYKSIFVAFFLIMVSIIPFLNNVVGESGSFFEIAFGLLLGLWGMHEILIPAYIGSSILIDIAIYTLYILVIVEILETLMVEYQKRRIRILDIDRQTYDSEHVVIENPSYFSINLTGWLLLDKTGNKYKLPKFTLKGRKILGGATHRVNIWTKDGKDTDTDLFWGRSNPVWGGLQDTAYLEDSKTEAIASFNKE